MDEHPTSHDDDSGSDGSDGLDPVRELLAAAEAIVAAAHPATSQFVPQRKRFNRALADLLLLELFGPDWIEIDGDLVTFGAIDRSRFDAIVRRLEDLATGVQQERPAPGRGQDALPFDVRPSSPDTSVSTHHVEVK